MCLFVCPSVIVTESHNISGQGFDEGLHELIDGDGRGDGLYVCLFVSLSVIVTDFLPIFQAKDLMKDYMSGLMETGGKMVILFRLIEESLAYNDKILVFR